MGIKDKLFKSRKPSPDVIADSPVNNERGYRQIDQEAAIAQGLGYIAECLQRDDLVVVYDDVRSRQAESKRIYGDLTPEMYAIVMGMSRLVPTSEFQNAELGITSDQLYGMSPEDMRALTKAAQEMAERLGGLYADTVENKRAFFEQYGVDPDTSGGRRLMEEKGINPEDVDTTNSIFRELRAVKDDYSI